VSARDTQGWRLTGRAVWAVGDPGVKSLAERLRADGADVTVSPLRRVGAWSEDGDPPVRRLDGLILVLDDPGDGEDRPTGRADRLAAIFCTARAAARRMDHAGGAVVLVAPDDTTDLARPESRSGALETLVRSLAIALGPAGISVNLVRVRSTGPTTRRWDPADVVAGPVTYLLARDTNYLTGQVLHVEATRRGEPQ
jgi:hypothetical protein